MQNNPKQAVRRHSPRHLVEKRGAFPCPPSPELRPPRSCPLPRGAGSEKPWGYTRLLWQWHRPATQRGSLYCPVRTAVKETSALSSALTARCNTSSFMSTASTASCGIGTPGAEPQYQTALAAPVAPGHPAPRAATPGVDKRDSKEKENRANNAASVHDHFGLVYTARAFCPSASWVRDNRFKCFTFAVAGTSRLNGALRKLGAQMF